VPPDPLLYRGCAEHYLRGRPPYSAQLVDVVRNELALDGHGTLVDIGCGPGVLAVQLAPLFDHAIGIDPDPDMLATARQHALECDRPQIEWRSGYAENLEALDLPPARIVSFGQSFHWTDREPVAAAVYELLLPGGSMILVGHDPKVGTRPDEPADPPIPDDEIQPIIARYLGPDYRKHMNTWLPTDRYEDALSRSTFGHARTAHAPGRADITRDVDGVISGYLSTSYSAPHRFGDRLDDFVAEARQLLESRTPTGRFSDWPGDTAIIIATKPA
jgi:SAM-dependent methyltransferase